MKLIQEINPSDFNFENWDVSQLINQISLEGLEEKFDSLCNKHFKHGTSAEEFEEWVVSNLEYIRKKLKIKSEFYD